MSKSSIIREINLETIQANIRKVKVDRITFESICKNHAMAGQILDMIAKENNQELTI